ncbi:N-acetyl sugar amidotransferase [Nitrosopumilus sp. b2]|uniref:N-acetyl sugar amidotransferase n=1 Tax=Nitrosopumilus sp. b2 TaxID=2109908 RepID=UPI0015F4B417|nr:N-acetyl sugar amidotransferase [Nitrosopumilus sp. b2]KAF6245779.1 N-acetyl sugar amidotransferase [Nitrosopumilus sp. b2]
MEYCKKCVMPNTRPGLKFENGICTACINYEKQKTTNWEKRFEELKSLCEKYRGTNGNGYDCAIAISGGKDSHFQVYYVKEVLKMNPLLLSVSNIDWTETGRKNFENISENFGCDVISFNPNRKVAKILFRKAFEKIGSPTWYVDALIYAFPIKMAIQLGIKLLFYGEDVNYVYGGKYDSEKASAKEIMLNDVVKPVWKEWFEDNQLTEKDLESVRMPTKEDIEKSELEPVYLSYFVPWDSHHNFEVAKRWGFKQLLHEYQREGTIEEYNQIDSIGYLLNQFMKYPKYAHSSATEIGSRWIRAGTKTREEVVKLVEEYDKNLDQGIIEKFCLFTGMTIPEFWKILDKWYNPEFFEQDKDGVWHEKFRVGKGIE